MSPNQQDTGGFPNLGGDDEVSVFEAIQTFETILEVFPEDVSALESLALAYEQAGDAAKGREKYLQLARIWAAQGEWNRVRPIARHLLERQAEDQEARALLQEAKAVLGEEEEPEPATPVSSDPQRTVSKLEVDLRGELELAWFLLQNNVINQDQYEKAIESLTESRMNPGVSASLSLLQELQVQEWIDMDKIIDFLAQEAGMPFIDLRSFEIDLDTVSAIPLDQCRRAGVLAFEKMGDEYMVALMNPVDPEIRKAIREFLGTQVHYFLTSPDMFQAALTNIETELQKR